MAAASGKVWLWGIAAVTATWAPTAWAQTGEPSETTAAEAHVQGAGGLGGFGLQLGGGVVDFASGVAREVARAGGAWDLRVTYGSRQILGWEVAYLGSAHPLNDLTTPPGAYVMSNGAETALRLNAPTQQGSWLVVPFALAGVGWNYYRSVDVGASGLLNGSDNLFTIPLGLGVAASYHGFTADVRLTYRPTLDDELFVNNASMRAWTAGGHVGYEF